MTFPTAIPSSSAPVRRARPGARLATWSSALALATAFALAGCGGHSGGGDDDDEVGGPPPPPPPASAPLRSSLVAAGSNTNLIEARTSQAPTAPGAAPSTVYDDFRLTAAGTVTSVSWQGIYCVQANGAAAPAPTATQFIITFYPDAAGRPDLAAPLGTTTVTPAAANQTFERNFPGLSCGSASNTTWGLYDYRATLAAPIALAAGTTYWFAVQAVTPSYDAYWGFRAGTTDNSLSLLRFMGAYETLTFDRAFALHP